MRFDEPSLPTSASASASGGTPSLTDAERAVLGAATAYARDRLPRTPAEDAYLDLLPGARRSILHRFVGGLLRGNPEGLPSAVALPGSAPELPDDAPPPLSGTTAERLFDDLEAAVDDGASGTSIPNESGFDVLAFPASGSAILAPVAARHGYGRRRIAGDVYRWRPDGIDRIAHPGQVVDPVARDGGFSDAEQADRIGAELDESVANLAFARLAGRRFSDRVADREVSVETLADAAPAADAAASLERLVLGGHPFHPAAKIRRGMSPGAALAYAPEFTGRIDVRFVAIRADHAKRTTAAGDRTLTERLYEAFDGLETAVAGALPPGRSRGEYAVVPVHPWQYHHVILDRYDDRIADGRVAPLPYSHPATPLLNLRTVVPHRTDRTGEHPPHLKLAIAVQTTNVERTLSPQAVHNGPRVTDVLRSIEAAESLERLGFLAEPATAGYHAPGGPHPEGEAYDDARHLGGLVRENPYAHPSVAEGATPVAASSLLARSPATDRPIVRDLIDRYRETTGGDVGSFLATYVETVVPEQLLLLSKYGVALESHAQNSYVVFEEGVPVATLVRDFGGIRALDDRLATHGLSVDTYPDSDVAAEGREDLYRKLYYALFQNHLAELIATVTWDCSIDEGTCWGLVREACERTFGELRADPAVPERWVEADREALFADPIDHKALTAMRLRGKRHEYVTSRVPNPLAR